MTPWQLPAITGRWSPAYRVIWLALFALALWSQLLVFIHGGTRTDVARVAHSRVGLETVAQTADKVGPTGDASRKAGIRDGDTLLRIGATAVDPHADWKDAGIVEALSGPDDSSVTLLLRGSDGALRTATLRRSDRYSGQVLIDSKLTPKRARQATAVMNTVTTVLLMVLAVMLFRQRPRDPVVALFTGWILLSNFDLSTLLPGLVDAHVSFCYPLIVALSGLAILCLESSLIVFPDGRSATALSRIALAGAGLNTLFFVYTALVPAPTAALIGNIIATTTLSLILLQQIQKYRQSGTDRLRQQTRWVLFGLTNFVILFALESVLIELAYYVPKNSGLSDWLNLAATFVEHLQNIVLGGGFLVALLGYRLYDAEAVISRSAAYALLTVMLAIIFAVSEKAIEFVGQDFFGGKAGALASGIAAGIAAVIVTPAHGRVHRWAEERFQKALVRLRTGLPPLVDDLREVVGLAPLLDAALARVQAGVRCSHASVALEEGGALRPVAARDADLGTVTRWCADWPGAAAERLDCDRRDPLFPARVALDVEGAGRIGWLLLGPRPDGSFFGKDERAVLVQIAGPIARAIEVVRQRTRWVDSVETRLKALEAK